jgi:hypothetical protein
VEALDSMYHSRDNCSTGLEDQASICNGKAAFDAAFCTALWDNLGGQSQLHV